MPSTTPNYPTTITTKVLTGANAAALQTAVDTYLASLNTAGIPWNIVSQSLTSLASDDSLVLNLVVSTTVRVAA